MEQIENLEEKIRTELQELRDRTKQKEDELIKFENIENLQKRASSTKESLHKLKGFYTERTNFIKKEVRVLSAKYEQNKKILGASNNWKSIQTQEQKICHQEQNVFNLKEFIATKGRQSDYESIKRKCLGLVTDLNKNIIEGL